MMTTADVAETAVVFLGLNSLSLTFLIAAGKLRTPKPRSRATWSTAARAAAEDAPSALAAGKPAVLTAVPAPAAAVVPPSGVTAVGDPLERRRHGLPPLPPASEMKHPTLAEYARGRPRDPRTGQFLKQDREAS